MKNSLKERSVGVLATRVFRAVFGKRPAPLDARQTRAAAIGLMCAAVVFFTAMDSTAKYLGRELSAFEIAWARYLGAAIVAAFATRVYARPRILRSARPGLQSLRSALLLGSTVANFYAVRRLQLAETSTIAFLAPILVALLAGPFLGERPEKARLAAIAVGFLGVLVATRPGGGALQPVVGVAMLGALCNAGYALATRGLAAHDRGQTTLLWTQLAGVVILTPLLPWFWSAPSHLWGWALMAALGASGAVGHGLLIKAHGMAPASALAPFGYIQLIWMIASGWLVFGDWPAPATLVGGAMVAGCGLFLLLYERRRLSPP